MCDYLEVKLAIEIIRYAYFCRVLLCCKC